MSHFVSFLKNGPMKKIFSFTDICPCDYLIFDVSHMSVSCLVISGKKEMYRNNQKSSREDVNTTATHKDNLPRVVRMNGRR